MNSDRLIQTFFELVRIDSPTGQESSVADYLVQKLSALGLHPTVDATGTVFVRKEGSGGPILLATHMDTVQPGKDIKPKIADGYLVSDGTTILGADNKIAIACILEMLEILSHTSDHKTLEILFTVAEETTMDGAICFDYSQLQSKTGYCFDAPGPVGTIITGSPYYDRFDITLTGKAAHASRHHESINALHLLREVLNTVKIGQLDEETICNIGMINGGHVRNTIPGEMLLQGEIRSFNEAAMDQTRKNMRESIDSIVAKHQAKASYDFIRENPGYVHDTNHPFFQKTIKIFEQQGLSPTLEAPWSISDANIFNTKGLFCINLSDGSEFSHTIQERISLVELEKLYRLLNAVVM